MSFKQLIPLLCIGFSVMFPLGLHAQPCTGMSISDADVMPISIVRAYYDNDAFVGTNRFYTQGARLEVITPSFSRLYLSKLLLLRIGRRSRTYYGLSLNHKAFTPEVFVPDTSVLPEILPGDRPFASTLSVGHFLISNDRGNRLRLTTEFEVGVLGPWALGRYLTGDFEGTRAWDTQIRPDILLGYSAQLEKGFVDADGFDFIAYGRANLNTVYPHIAAGGQIRVGLLNPYFHAVDFMPRSAHGGRDIRNLQLYLFFKGEARFIGYDATLQGGLINRSSPYTLSGSDLNRVIAVTESGLKVIYKNVGAGFSLFLVTPEFEGAESHSYGQVSLLFAF
ncbi:MAG: lipid A deacylase LpxR family protein [Bacteroidota bacterium]